MLHTFVRLLIWSILFIWSNVAQAQNASVATLEGTVMNAITRQPIIGASVQATPLSTQMPPITGRSGTNGNFVLRLDPSLTYSILTRAEGFKDQEEKLAFSDQRAYRLYGKQILLEPGNSPPKPSLPLTLPTILFAPRRADLSPEAISILREVAALLEANPTVRIEAAGHTDTIGDIGLNRILGLERAEAVRTFLLQMGIPTSRVEIRSYGGTRPLPGPLSAQRRARNKRVELKVLNRDQ
jgi:OmpA-OmpF porin, OOP family